MDLTIFLVLGKKTVLYGVDINIDDCGVLVCLLHLFPYCTQAFVEGFCHSIMDTQASNSIQVALPVWIYCKFFGCTARRPCIVYPKFSTSILVEVLHAKTWIN